MECSSDSTTESSALNNAAETSSINQRFRYNALHLNSHDVMFKAIHTVRLIGKTLGSVNCAKLIHKCMVDLQDDLMKADWTKYGKGQVNWLKHSLGILALVNEVSFCSSDLHSSVSYFMHFPPLFSQHTRKS